MAEAATGCAKHGNVKAEAATGYAKHGNVKAEAATGYTKHGNVKAEAATGCAKHGNVKAEAAAKKTEVATRKVNSDRLFLEVHCLTCVSDRPESFLKMRSFPSQS